MEFVLNLILLPILIIEVVALIVFVVLVVMERGKLKQYAKYDGEVRGLRLSGGFVSLMSTGWAFIVVVTLYMMGAKSGAQETLVSGLLTFVCVVATAILLAMNSLWRSEKKRVMLGYKKRSPQLVN